VIFFQHKTDVSRQSVDRLDQDLKRELSPGDRLRTLVDYLTRGPIEFYKPAFKNTEQYAGQIREIVRAIQVKDETLLKTKIRNLGNNGSVDNLQESVATYRGMGQVPARDLMDIVYRETKKILADLPQELTNGEWRDIAKDLAYYPDLSDSDVSSPTNRAKQLEQLDLNMHCLPPAPSSTQPSSGRLTMAGRSHRRRPGDSGGRGIRKFKRD